MIQFNLLPSVKVEYIKTKRLKRLIIGLSFVAIAFAVLVLIVSFSLKAVQSAHLNNLNNDITSLTNELNSKPDLTTIISVQNQLKALPALYDGRPAVDRLPTYLDQTTPVNIGISSINVDFSASLVEVQGSADSLESVNRFVDTLKFTNYRVEEQEGSMAAFKDVVLVSFGKDDTGTRFTISYSFDPAIFDNTKLVTLDIPTQVTTHAQANTQNTELFNDAQGAEGGN